ncbi:MAG: hypothetical protein AAF203_11040, partial [Pseudomonadota bacterium]
MRRFVTVAFAFLFLLPACQTDPTKKNPWISGEKPDRPGWATVIQTATSDTETTINVLRPRLTETKYYVLPEESSVEDFKAKNHKGLKVSKTITGPHIHWEVDRIHIEGLKPGKAYKLVLAGGYRGRVKDWRTFKTLDIQKKSTRFIVGSCMSDSPSFKHIRDKIWDRMKTHNPDFLMLVGDLVYVDDFGFVKRKKAQEFDVWTRYIDSLRKISFFHQRDLIPVLAVWDDHDSGTDNSDKRFKGLKAARKVFQAFFGGQSKSPSYDFA